MQFPLALLVVSATVAFALPENEKPQSLDLHRTTGWKWTSSLRSLLQVDARPNEEYHESQQSSLRSRISRRRRNHP